MRPRRPRHGHRSGSRLGACCKQSSSGTLQYENVDAEPPVHSPWFPGNGESSQLAASGKLLLKASMPLSRRQSRCSLSRRLKRCCSLSQTEIHFNKDSIAHRSSKDFAVITIAAVFWGYPRQRGNETLYPCHPAVPEKDNLNLFPPFWNSRSIEFIRSIGEGA